MSAVFDVIEPFATRLARSGRAPWNRRSMLKLIGQALRVQHRVSGRVAVEEKPDILWDRPDLERLYSRLEDEYELKERAGALSRKLAVVVETGRVLTDILDTDRAMRLEATIVVLIVMEILVTLYRFSFTAAIEPRVQRRGTKKCRSINPWRRPFTRCHGSEQAQSLALNPPWRAACARARAPADANDGSGNRAGRASMSRHCRAQGR